jgi:hypothetical protein
MTKARIITEPVPRDRLGRPIPAQCQALSAEGVVRKITDLCMPIPESGCWVYLGNLSKRGYGQIFWRQKNYQVHRLVYELMVQPIPDGLVIDHKCRVHSCCNPAHLEPVTNRVNVLRGVGLSAMNAQKTHCLQGHPLTGDNLYRSTVKRGVRRCRLCGNAYARALWRKTHPRAVIAEILGEKG